MTATINQAIEFALQSYAAVGLRYDDRDLADGEDLGDSYRWDDGEDTGEQLDGTCAINAQADNALALIAGYKSFGHLYLIGGQVAMSGEDPGEIVIQEAVVISRLLITR